MRGRTNFSSAIWNAAKTLSSLLQKLCTDNPIQIIWASSSPCTSNVTDSDYLGQFKPLHPNNHSNCSKVMVEGGMLTEHCSVTNITVNHTQALSLLKRINYWILWFWKGITVPANTYLGWVAGAKSLQQRRQCFSSTSNGWGEICASAHAFLAFLGYLWFWMGNI